MSIATPVYNQLLSLLNEHSQYRDLRHLKALAWMINALICSGTINLSEWESYVTSRGSQAQSTERRWQRFLKNHRIRVRSLYVPLVMAAISNWQGQRLYLACLYHSVMESLLHHSSLSCLLWSSRSLSMESKGTQECYSGFWGIQINVEAGTSFTL